MRPASRTCLAACRIFAKVQELVGYEPKVRLNEIITRVIEYFRTHEP